jgi:hypothetical protein
MVEVKLDGRKPLAQSLEIFHHPFKVGRLAETVRVVP